MNILSNTAFSLLGGILILMSSSLHAKPPSTWLNCDSSSLPCYSTPQPIDSTKGFIVYIHCDGQDVPKDKMKDVHCNNEATDIVCSKQENPSQCKCSNPTAGPLDMKVKVGAC